MIAVAAGAVVLLDRPSDGSRVPGEGANRILVEVLNATRIDGLARETTRRLRSQGIDVVYFGTARDSTRDSTLLVVRRGDAAVARRVRAVLGRGVISEDPDPRLLLDVSVILGRDLAPDSSLDP